MREAAKKSFKCFEYLYSQNYKWDRYDCFYAAAKGGNIECLRFIHDIIHPHFLDINISSVELCTEASRTGSLECLKFLHENGCPWNKEVSSAASQAGSIDCLRYLNDNGCPMDQKCTLEAAKHGFIECLRYLHEHGCKWNFEECCREAAKNGHLPCLQYLHENGRQLSSSLYCDCMESCCDWPRTGLSCLQYLQDMDIQTPLEAVNDAIEYKLEDMFEYFNLEEMTNDVENGNKPFLKAIQEQWLFPSISKLYKDEWKIDAIYCQTSARCGGLRMLKYLLENGFLAPDNICVDAAVGGNIECLKFLHKRGFEMNQDALNAAKVNNHVSCINYCTNPHLYDLNRSKVRRKRKASEALIRKESSV